MTRRLESMLSGAAGLSLAAASAGADGSDPEAFNAFLTPESQLAGIGELVDVRFEVDWTATQFNGYALTITWDSDVVSLEDIDEGSLMTGACANRFAHQDAAPDSVTYTHVLLCAGVTIEGPGVLSVYRFRTLAFGQAVVRIVSDPDCTFFDAGTCVGRDDSECPRAVRLSDASILVTDGSTAVGESLHGGGVPRLVASPNPTSSATTLSVHGLPGHGATLEIFTVDGRRLHVVEVGDVGSPVVWHGRDARGRRVPPGVYLARVASGPARAETRVVVE